MVTKTHRFVCPTHSEATQYSNIRVWNGERFITGPCKEMGGSCSKSPNVTDSFPKAFLKANGERGVWLIVANLLVSDPLLSQMVK